MKVIERIFLTMQEKNIKDKPVYTAAKVHKNTFSGWRQTLKNPDIETLPDIAKVLNVSLSWLITGKENPEAEELSDEEKKLLKYYQNCNQEGKNRIMEHAEFIQSKYTAFPSSRKSETA